MSKVWIVAALVAAAAGAAAGFVLVKSRVPDFGPAGPNRDLAPESLACYAEIGDGAGLWTKMQGTEAWNDLAASKLAAAVVEAKPVKEFLAALDQVAAKSNYRIDAKNAMKLVGREVSVGVKLDPAGGVPQVLVLTKLDTAALAKDLLKGGTDLDALWAEMQRRTGNLDFKITASEHRGQKMAAAARGDESYHAALLGDTLAVATDAALVRAAIDCRLDGGAKSIGHRAAFQADMKALPAGPAIVEWYDLDALDAGRTSLDAGLARFSTNEGVAGAVHAILDGTKGAHTLARAWVLPDGDLYRVSWKYSKSDDLFADRASPPMAALLQGDWAAYGEVRQIGGVTDAWRRSSLRKNLTASELDKWFDGVMDDPSKTVGGMWRIFGHAMPGAAALDLDEQDPAAKGHDPVSVLDALCDRFTSKMGLHLWEQWLDALTKGEAAAAFDLGGESGSEPRVAAALRLDTEGRLLAFAAQGALQGTPGSLVTSEACGARRVWSYGGEKHVHWTQVGDTVVIGNDLELVRRAAGADGAAAAAPGALATAVSEMKPGWRACLAYDLDRLLKALNGAMANRMHGPGGATQIEKTWDLYREAGAFGSSGAVAVYVPDDFAAIEVRSRMHLAPATTDDGRALRAEFTDVREPRCWASLPDSTIMHSSAPASGVRTLRVMVNAMAQILGSGKDAIDSAFREAMGMDLDKELIPALGRELYFAVTFTPAPSGAAAGKSAASTTPNDERQAAAPDSPPIVLPGIVFGIEVKDPAVVRKALDRAIELAEEAIRESQHEPGENLFSREAHEGVEIVKLTLPPGQLPVPIEPACALHDGFLVITLHSETLRTCVDVQKGKAPRLADSPVFAAASGELGRKCASFMLLDWNRLADQVAVYAPLMGQAFAGDDVQYPEFPENGDQEEWRRRVGEYQKKLAAGRGAGEAKARRWIDAFRVVDYVGSNVTATGDTTESTFVVRFKK
jgi:hypothetical protein